MSWQEIMELVLEIAELQEEVSIKSQNQLIKQIINRKQKYLSRKSIDMKSLNDAVLEHRLRLTPYQTTILDKVNRLSLTTDIQTIYMNMPESQSEAENYVLELKAKYELALKCFDLVIDIERISETEYIFDYPFENSVYAKKEKVQNDLFSKYILDNSRISKEMLESIITNTQKEFMDSLSVEEKKQLFIESLVLSYDRNVFNYFNATRNISEAYSKRSVKSPEFTYNLYKSFLIDLENRKLLQMPLQQVYDELGIIYETDFYKQKMMKK